jgi:AMMECR1 domain-containing protein
MGCCGKISDIMKKGGKLISIANGNIGFFVEEQFNVPIFKCEQADKKLTICLRCDKRTWLTKETYFAFIKKHWLEVIKNFADLTLLPDLPKENVEANKYLFCVLCKCHLPAKTRIETEKCPENKW